MQSHCAVLCSSVMGAAAVTLRAHEVQTRLGAAGGSCQWCDSHAQRVSFGRSGLSKMGTVYACLLLKAESPGVYIVHVLWAVTNLMRFFSLTQNRLWLWCFMVFFLSVNCRMELAKPPAS